MTYVILFIFGLAIGSFLNVVSLRYEPGNKVLDLKIIGGRPDLSGRASPFWAGRSLCMHCGKTLKWHELIPLFSFLIQKGKCRSCGNRLSWQYPIVELLTGLIFVFVPLHFNLQPTTYNLQQLLVVGCWLLVFLLFLLLSIIDFRHYIIPDSINSFLAILGISLIFVQYLEVGLPEELPEEVRLPQINSFLGHYSLLFGFQNNLFVDSDAFVVLNRVFADVAAMAFFAAIIILSRGRGMGWGDFKLVGALGLIFGWPDILMIIFLSFITGSIAVLPLLIKKQKTMKDVVPFGPFLIIGASLTFFLGYQIIDGYFKLFGLL